MTAPVYDDTAILVGAVRVGSQLVFPCPQGCWTTARGGSGFRDVFRKRPKTAFPAFHYHGAGGPEFGSGNGNRTRHCLVLPSFPERWSFDLCEIRAEDAPAGWAEWWRRARHATRWPS
jgi:hypothetical protein